MFRQFIHARDSIRGLFFIPRVSSSDKAFITGYETQITSTKTTPELLSQNYVIICGRVHRAPQWYEEDGKRLIAFGVRTTYSRIKRDMVKVDGRKHWSHSTLMSRHHRCVCGHTQLGEEELDLEKIYKDIAAGDLALVRGSIRYPTLYDRMVDNVVFHGVDLLVASWSIVTQGDGQFNSDMLYSQNGKKINIPQLNKNIENISRDKYGG